MNTSARLSKLVRSIPGEPIEIQQDALITGIELDSRRILPGNLFVALSGASTDGHRFIPEAIQRGAAAIVGTLALDNLPVPYIRVGDGRQALAFLSAAFYRFPAHRLVVTGVTGTDGKTTTANLIYQILRAAGLRTGVISTVNAVIGDESLDTGFHVTTPEAPEVQNYLARMVAAGLTHVVLEATSHGLAQQRVTACEFDLGVVTNVTHEHLDFHGSYDAYLQAKGRLFRMLARTPRKPCSAPRGAVLNRDDTSYDYLAAITEVPQLSYGLHPQAQVSAAKVTQMSQGLRFAASGIDLQGRRFDFPVDSKLIGAFNLSNCLAAIAATVGVIGVDVGAAQQGIAALAGVPGRMERLDLGQDFTAIVDFAHTPNALWRALETARELATGRVIAVFGSAGLRDQEKRGLMAQISAELADLTILTAEDPRSESLESILDEMAAGATKRGAVEDKTYWSIPDRGEAIRFAVQIARPGDLVIVCGKGHEQSMCFGEIEYPWDDRTALHAALAERLGIPGPGMPFLPTNY